MSPKREERQTDGCVPQGFPHTTGPSRRFAGGRVGLRSSRERRPAAPPRMRSGMRLGGAGSAPCTLARAPHRRGRRTLGSTFWAGARRAVALAGEAEAAPLRPRWRAPGLAPRRSSPLPPRTRRRRGSPFEDLALRWAAQEAAERTRRARSRRRVRARRSSAPGVDPWCSVPTRPTSRRVSRPAGSWSRNLRRNSARNTRGCPGPASGWVHSRWRGGPRHSKSRRAPCRTKVTNRLRPAH